MLHKKLPEHTSDWHERERYLAKVRRMDWEELKLEIIEQKRHLGTLDVHEMEHKLVIKRTLAAYKLSAINKYLEIILEQFDAEK